MGGDTGKDRSKIKYSLSWRRAQKLPVSSKRAPQLPISQFPPEHNNTLIMSAINTNEGKKKKAKLWNRAEYLSQLNITVLSLR